eukprot:TRINITY_DN9182_c0_g1_i1.p1 TRINITY_DN9182_c0_g1~~TRINITY_DN9182_c0_g1_i1.p1  ORF type:complete len:127 (+),score=27.36 TRINITY_DN9182_c0_g1_i1:76-456(+)
MNINSPRNNTITNNNNNNNNNNNYNNVNELRNMNPSNSNQRIYSNNLDNPSSNINFQSFPPSNANSFNINNVNNNNNNLFINKRNITFPIVGTKRRLDDNPIKYPSNYQLKKKPKPSSPVIVIDLT